jgi:hypothetical protein
MTRLFNDHMIKRGTAAAHRRRHLAATAAGVAAVRHQAWLAAVEDARFELARGCPPTRFPTMLTGVHQGPPSSVTCPNMTAAVAGERRRTGANE